jgi:hypothetical protein
MISPRALALRAKLQRGEALTAIELRYATKTQRRQHEAIVTGIPIAPPVRWDYDQVAAAISVPRGELERLVAAGRFPQPDRPAERNGWRSVFDPDAVRAWIAALPKASRKPRRARP